MFSQYEETLCVDIWSIDASVSIPVVTFFKVFKHRMFSMAQRFESLQTYWTNIYTTYNCLRMRSQRFLGHLAKFPAMTRSTKANSQLPEWL